MIRDDFRIGMEFYTATGRWRCTDVGTRVIVAIRFDKDDVSWYAGPPFAVAEWVFDEYDTSVLSPKAVVSVTKMFMPPMGRPQRDGI